MMSVPRRAKPLPLIAAVALAACDNRPDQWDAFIYPDVDNQQFERINGFKSFELCQQAAIDRIRSFREPDKADYECGYRCEFKPEYGTNICKETEK